MLHRLIPILLLSLSGLLSAQSPLDSLNYFGLHLTAGIFQSFGVSGDFTPWLPEEGHRIYATRGFELGIDRRFRLGFSSALDVGVGLRYYTLKRTESRTRCGVVPPCWEEVIDYNYRQPEATARVGIRKYGNGRWHYGGALGVGYRLTNDLRYTQRNDGPEPTTPLFHEIITYTQTSAPAPFAFTESRLNVRLEALLGYRINNRWRLELAAQQQFNQIGIYTICGPNENCAQPNGTPLIEARPLNAVLRAQFAL